MAMLLIEQEFEVRAAHDCYGLLGRFRDSLRRAIGGAAKPIRFAVTASTEELFQCEVGVLSNGGSRSRLVPDLFECRPRSIEDQSSFNAVMIVPTGVGAAVGGHAGDATPAAQLLAQGCDTLITHPNVINASDIGELPENGLYVEGSILSRFMLGTIGLQAVRANRVLVVVEPHPARTFVHDTINAVNGARATYGLSCPEVVVLDSPYKMRARFTSQGTAAGRVENLLPLVEMLEDRIGSFDAVALASLVDLPNHLQQEYFTANDDCECVNPWGGVEAMLTHTISGLFNVPSAHAPMMESVEVANMDFGVVDPRKAAEMISLTFFNSVLKGLQRSPGIVTDAETMKHPSVLTAENISVLIQPDKCLGLPTLAALEQGIPIIAVRENTSVMRNDLDVLPWRAGQLIHVKDYLEAAGIMLAMKSGLSLDSVRRPLHRVAVVGDFCPEREHNPNADDHFTSLAPAASPPQSQPPG